MSDAPAVANEVEDAESVEVCDVYDEPEDDADAEADDEWIGKVKVEGDGRLELVAAVPARETFLREVIARVNGKPEIALISQEPQAERYALGVVVTGRDDPAFIAALRTYLLTYYGLRLS